MTQTMIIECPESLKPIEVGFRLALADSTCEGCMFNKPQWICPRDEHTTTLACYNKDEQDIVFFPIESTSPEVNKPYTLIKVYSLAMGGKLVVAQTPGELRDFAEELAILDAIKIADDVFLLGSASSDDTIPAPIKFYNEAEFNAEIRQKALSKLSNIERRTLGL